MQEFRFYVPTDLRFGEGILKEEALYELPYKRVLIVTTAAISNGRYGALKTIEEQLKTQGIETVLFDEVTRPLNTNTILKGAKVADDHEVDAVIAHGGAKVIDAGKVIARMAREKAPYLSAWLSSHYRPPFDHEPLDVIAVPTSLTLVASLNHKIYIYDAPKARYIRIKDSSFTPKKAWVDPLVLSTLPGHALRNAVVEGMVRAFELIRLDVSVLHREQAVLAMKTFLSHAQDALHSKKVDAFSALAHANILLGFLYVKKPYFPLHMLNDTVQGFHPELHFGRFLYFAAPHYLRSQVEILSDGAHERLVRCFKEAGLYEGSLATSFQAFIERLNPSGDSMKEDRLEKKYPEDYLIHLKTLFPEFTALKDQTVYKLIEDTML
ncbi:MAG: iron-containing alcohol dehydrogenase [Candidatus Izemoplasmataceae bacterium]